MPAPCTFPSLATCQKRFLWPYKEADLAPHTGVGLLLQVADAEKFAQAFGLGSLDSSLGVGKQGSIYVSQQGKPFEIFPSAPSLTDPFDLLHSEKLAFFVPTAVSLSVLLRPFPLSEDAIGRQETRLHLASGQTGIRIGTCHSHDQGNITLTSASTQQL